jgi:hypothetical protein
MKNNDICIKYHKWDKNDKRYFFKSCNDILNITNLQFFQPFFSLYFKIHNTKNSHRLIDINHNINIKKIIKINTEKYYTSNLILNCDLYNKKKNMIYNEDVFCKCIPLLDPMYFMMNNYNNLVHRNPLLPSCFNYNTFKKINDIDNSAYIDTFFSFISSEITTNNILPSFPLFYGSVNGIKNEFNHDITEDYYTFKNDNWFKENLGKNYTLDIYKDSESDSEESNSEESDSEESNSEESDSDDSTVSSTTSNYNDYVALLKNIPCQLFFIEKLDGTLEDLLDDNFDPNIILSCIFQISFSLCYLQKYYNFSHNDLHINNIMFKKTEKEFFYYKYNNIYFKVPTYGYVFKLIDFGRCIFTYHNKLFYNDAFQKHGEAEGQFESPYNYLNFTNNNNNFKLNYNFDLCRLAITIIEVCNYNENIKNSKYETFLKFLYNLTLDKECNSFLDHADDFSLYISISKNAINSSPFRVIQNEIFKEYRVKKRDFPKKIYYHL